MRDAEALTDLIPREAIAIHRDLRPGLFESADEIVLADALAQAGVAVERQVVVPIHYQGRYIAEAFRIDLLVERQVVVECKSTEKTLPIHSQQLLTYLRLGGFDIGLLLNFGMGTLMEGIRRLVNDYRPVGISKLQIGQNPLANVAPGQLG